jgi:hypothetical protein
MVDEVSAKLSDLEQAAAQLESSRLRIETAADSIRQACLELSGLADSAAFPVGLAVLSAGGHAQRVTFALQRLSSQLSTAHSALAHAIMPALTPLGALWNRPYYGDLTPRLPIASTADATPLRYAGFVSRVNVPLAERVMALKAELTQQTEANAGLVARRNQVIEEASTLEDRMASYGTANPSEQARIIAMRAQAAQLDRQIISGDQRIGVIQTEMHGLEIRLERVAPPQTADLALIRSLEGTHSADYVQKYTYDCVNHVVTRVPIPDVMARDAHLWDTQAELYPQLGITTGSTPLEGAVLVLEREHPYADDRFGHLMVVERVDTSGGVWITDNIHPDIPVRLQDIIPDWDSDTMKYLYLPWNTRG